MILVWLVALSSLAVGGEASCSNAPCAQTDYRSYSRCIQNQCANAVVATGCDQGGCASVNCNTCSSSSSACCKSCCPSASSCECQSVNCNTCTKANACCQSCCKNQCECPNVDCGTCQGYTPCCQSCCQKDCCQASNKGDCCKDSSDSKCCERSMVIQAPAAPALAPQPPIIVMPNITLPNITIFVNQNPVLSYNVSGISLNQTCGGVTSQTNDSRNIYTMRENCSIVSSPSSPCCAMPYSPGCYPTPIPPYSQCPTIGYNYACGPQCLLQPPQVYQPSPIPPPPMVFQPPITVYQPPPPQPQPVLIRPAPPPPPPPQIYQPPPQIYQPPPQIYQPQPQIYQPQPQIYQPQPQIYQPPPQRCVINMPYQQCPQQCPSCVYQPYQMGGYQSGCVPSPSWPFVRCPQIAMPMYGGFQGMPGVPGMPVMQQNQPIAAAVPRG